jgi:hypothetical protein
MQVLLRHIVVGQHNQFSCSFWSFINDYLISRCWCSFGRFSTSSAYRALFTRQFAVLGTKELWKSCAPNKCCFFVWLVLHGRCWTSNRLFKHDLRGYRDCVLYCQSPEDLDHLLLSCSFCREISFKVLRRCGLQQLSPSPGEAFTAWWITSRKRVPKAHHKAVDLLMIFGRMPVCGSSATPGCFLL